MSSHCITRIILPYRIPEPQLKTHESGSSPEEGNAGNFKIPRRAITAVPSPWTSGEAVTVTPQDPETGTDQKECGDRHAQGRERGNGRRHEGSSDGISAVDQATR